MKQTVLHTISADSPDPALIAAAGDVLKGGGLVAFPTETVYGLGADASRPLAVGSVFAAKGRPQDNPLIVHIAEVSQVYELANDVSAEAATLMQRFWPGPLTLILRAKDVIPRIVTGGLETVALRMPAHKVARELCRTLTHGMVGPSANLSGRPSPTTAQHVFDDFNGKIDMILDAGPTSIGVESTVIDVTVSPPVILRYGGTTQEDLEAFIPGIQKATQLNQLKRSPGTRYRHYAPHAKVILMKDGDGAAFAAGINMHKSQGLIVGAVYHTKAFAEAGVPSGPNFHRYPEDDYARQIFASLRALDRTGVNIILVEEVPEIGLGKAVMDRLRRAAE